MNNLSYFERNLLKKWNPKYEKEECDRLWEDISKIFHQLWEKHPLFQHFILSNFKGKKKYELTLEMLRRLFRYSSIRQEKKLISLYEYIYQISWGHGRCLVVEKDKDLNEISYFLCPKYSPLINLVFRVKGEEIKVTSRTHIQTSPHKIEIKDVTSKNNIEMGNVSQILQILSGTSWLVPAFISYYHPTYGKRLLVCIPEGLPGTLFMKKYGTILAEVSQDFFQKTFKRRPRSIFDQENLIRDASKEYKDRISL